MHNFYFTSVHDRNILEKHMCLLNLIGIFCWVVDGSIFTYSLFYRNIQEMITKPLACDKKVKNMSAQKYDIRN